MDLVLYVTNKCNLNCTYCFVNKSNEVMKMKTYIDAFNKYKEKIDTITFFGGEPLLYTKLISQIIEYNKSNGYYYNYVINTNGIGINDNLISLCKNNNILINVSLDGCLKSNIKNRFEEEKFKLVEKNIKMLKDNKIKFVINYVITPNNIEYIEESLWYFVQNCFMEVCLMINYDALWSEKDITLMKQQFEKSIPVMLKMVKNNFIRLSPIYNKINCIINGIPEVKCNFGKEVIVIDCDGKKYPCMSFVGNKNYEIVDDKQDFINTCDVKKCKNCEYLNLCNNNCMCRNCNINKDSKIDVNCECEKIFIEIAKKIVDKISNHQLYDN